MSKLLETLRDQVNIDRLLRAMLRTIAMYDDMGMEPGSDAHLILPEHRLSLLSHIRSNYECVLEQDGIRVPVESAWGDSFLLMTWSRLRKMGPDGRRELRDKLWSEVQDGYEEQDEERGNVDQAAT